MTVGISPLEMASAFGTFANRGVYVEPIAYTKITNKNGDVLLENIPMTTQAMDPGVAFIVQDMLRTNVTSGTNRQAAIGIQPVAGKTGTTNDRFDAWFVGFTPQYTASLWIGNDINIALDQGSIAASRLWSKIMRQVSEGFPPGQFASAPSNVISVTVDVTSGMLPSDISAFGHRGTRSEFFIRGTEPQAVDNIHTFVNVCTESWHLSTPLCPHSTAAFGVRRPYVPDPAVGDIRHEVPHFYCFIHNPDPDIYPIDTNAPWEYSWEGRDTIRDPEPDPDPDQPDEMNGMPPHVVDTTTDSDPGDGLIDSNIYDDMPEFLRDW
jgi:penicillin-binding protein 1A